MTEADQISEILQQIEHYLEDLNENNKAEIFERFLECDVSSNDILLNKVVNLIVEQAIKKPDSLALFAELCKTQIDVDFNKTNDRSTFFHHDLLRILQHVFEMHNDGRNLIMFIGHLYRQKIVMFEVFLYVLFKSSVSFLPENNEAEIDETNIQKSIELVKLVGDLAEKEDGTLLDEWFELMQRPFAKQKTREMFNDLIELRNNGWVRRTVEEEFEKFRDEISALKTENQETIKKAEDFIDSISAKINRLAMIYPNSAEIRELRNEVAEIDFEA